MKEDKKESAGETPKEEIPMVVSEEERTDLQIWRNFQDHVAPVPAKADPASDSLQELPEIPTTPPAVSTSAYRRFARKFRLLPQQLLRWIMPEVAIPSYCLDCGARLELVENQILQQEEDWATGAFIWRCPSCKDSSSLRYRITRYLEQ